MGHPKVLFPFFMKTPIKKTYIELPSPKAYHDIVLVELTEPVTIGSQAEPLCLPDSADSNPDSMAEFQATLVGYGPATDNSTKVNQIKHRIEYNAVCAGIHDPEKVITNSNTWLKEKIKVELPHMFENGLVCGGDHFNPNFG